MLRGCLARQSRGVLVYMLLSSLLNVCSNCNCNSIARLVWRARFSVFFFLILHQYISFVSCEWVQLVYTYIYTDYSRYKHIVGTGGFMLITNICLYRICITWQYWGILCKNVALTPRNVHNMSFQRMISQQCLHNIPLSRIQCILCISNRDDFLPI